MNTQKSYITWNEDKKYTVFLDGVTGEVIGYSVFMISKGGKGTFRRLWAKVDGKPMPKNLKNILNQPNAPEMNAAAMEL